MSEPKWTPGPWRAGPRYPQVIYSYESRVIARASYEYEWSADRRSEAIANGRLIAAAPMLYERLAILVADIEHGDVPAGDVAAAKNVLAEARGEAPEVEP